MIKNKFLKLLTLLLVFSLSGMPQTGAYFTSQVTVSNITVTTGYWEKPTLVSPGNNSTITSGSQWDLNPLMDWSYSLDGSGITYTYESSLEESTNPDGSLTNPIYVSTTITGTQLPAPGTPDGVYFWHVQAHINGQNSPWSDTWKFTVNRTQPTPTPTATPTPTPTLKPGDVVINEIMWMGSSKSSADEWIELKNTTNQNIDISNWRVEKAAESRGDLIISQGYSIPAKGFFLVSNYNKGNTSSALNVQPDYYTSKLELINNYQDNGALVLKDSNLQVIDSTPTPSTESTHWPEGINNTTDHYYKSMERNDDPASGWHGCFDSDCNTSAFWNPTDHNYGTPKAVNLSSNDPSSAGFKQSLDTTPESTSSSTINTLPQESSASAAAEASPSAVITPTETSTPTPVQSEPTPEQPNSPAITNSAGENPQTTPIQPQTTPTETATPSPAPQTPSAEEAPVEQPKKEPDPAPPAGDSQSSAEQNQPASDPAPAN
jgi:hypothetical protein